MLNKQNIKEIYPLSSMQENMLFHSLMDNNETAYFEQTSYTITGELNIDDFKESIHFLIERHDILRTIFIYKNVSRPFQVVLKQIEPDIEIIDASGFAEDRKETYFQDLKKKDIRTPFNLSEDVLMRIKVVKFSENQFSVIWSHHHILMDGWCMSLIIKEFLDVYKALRKGVTPSLPAAIPYVNYIKWLEKQDKKEAGTYWKNYLSPLESSASFSPKKGGEGKPFKKHVQEYVFDPLIGEKINTLCKENGITMNSFFQAAWSFLLSKYNYTDTVSFGAVVSGRPSQITGVESIMGLFINTIPVVASLPGNSSSIDVAKQLQKENSQNTNYDYLPLAEIQKQSDLGNHLFDHILVYENYPVVTDIENLDTSTYGFSISNIQIFEQTNYDLTVVFIPKGNEIKVKYDVNESVYPSSYIAQIHEQFSTVLDQIIERSYVQLDDISVITQKERHNTVQKVSSAISHQASQTVLDVFEQVVAQHPDAIAVEFEETSSTYFQIAQKANKLAKYLNEKGITSGDVVAILADRSDLIIVSILGVLKSGAAYLPIDKSNPEERVAYMLSDSKCKLLITDESSKTDIETFDIHDINQLPEASGTINNSIPDGLAYIIYTSGSTGQPKGCQLLHENLFNYIAWANQYYFDESTAFGNTALYTSLSFDLTVTCIYSPLTRGKSIKIYPQKEEVETILKDIFSPHTNIDFIKITPAHSVLLPHVGLHNSNIKGVIVGGEELKKEHIANLLSLQPDMVIFNEYGPTETTVGCSVKKITGIDDEITIGHPVGNNDILIVDRNLNILPSGLEGEICVVGNSVGIGYFGKPELTAEKFVNHPLLNRIMYRTGDLGTWLSSGELQFFGRIDSQTKVRGYRIETGEIEYHLTQLPIIEKAYVTATHQQTLCAYVVTTQAINSVEINEELKKILPVYMLPDAYIVIDEIPLTINGKVDQKALPSPTTVSQHEYIAPSTENEIKLAEVWKKVLEVEKVGVNDNFFELGGHSLKTTILSSMILKEFGKDIKLKHIFEYPVFAQQIKRIEGEPQSDYVAITPVKEQLSYPTSFAQQRLFLLHQIDKGSMAYNIPAILQINGEVNIAKLESTFRQLVDRHEILRTSFHLENDETIQKIAPNVTFNIHVEDLNGKPIESFIQPFDLGQAPLMRLVLAKIDDNQHLMVLDMHHIISDAVSMSIFIKEFTALYNGETLAPIDIHYKDFAEWQQDYAQSDTFLLQKKYWLEEYSTLPDPLLLPYKSARPKHQTFEGGDVSIDVSDVLLQGLEKISKEKDATLYMTLLAAFNVLLYKYSGQKDLVVGSPVSGRTHPDVQEMLGVFINTMPIRTALKEEDTFEALLSQVKEKALKAFDHQDYPFEMLVDALDINRDLSRNPLFDVMFSLQNANNKMPELKGSTLFAFPQEEQSSKFDLTLEVVQYEGGISFTFQYATSLFDKSFIEQVAAHYVYILEQVTENAKFVIDDITLVSEQEKAVLLYDFNNTACDFEDTKTLHQLFEEKATHTPDAIALVFENEQLTYKQLNEKANQLAYLLIDTGIVADDIVALITHRSLEMVVSMFAIHKAGGAYMPIDPEVPSERLKYLLADSNAKVVLTNTDLAIDTDAVIMDVSDTSLYQGNSTNPTLDYHNENLAYVIYTSGSTGQPKGVMLEHKGVVNRIQWMKEQYGFSAKETVLQKTTYTFDVSVWEFFMTLCYGAKLILCRKEVISNIDLLVNIIEKEKISTLHFVPSMFKVFLSGLHQDNVGRLDSIKTIFTSGEALNLEHVHQHHQLLNAKLHNLYGPTEASIDVSYFETGPNDIKVPIGKPVWNTQLLILDKKLRLVPIGVSGELHIGGVQLARGYLNKPELTDEKFIHNPFDSGTKLYKTGDVTRWLPDGNIEYLGRSDFQVKIRGFRIELGDIESQLLKMGQYKDLAVIDRSNKEGEKYLCGYIVSKEELPVDNIRTYLAKELPEYMIPSFFIRMDELPLSSSGKLDRKALPEPTFGSDSTNKTLPNNKPTQNLAVIWKDVLGLEEVYLEDNFFNLGGHSLKAAIVVSRVAKVFNVDISIKDIFTSPSLKELSGVIARASSSAFSAIQKADPASSYPLSSAQKRIFIIEQFESTGTTYNMPGAIHIRGTIDKKKIADVFNALVQRHESLRTSFMTEGETPRQIVHESVKVELQEDAGKVENAKSLFHQFIKPFNLATSPLLRLKLVEVTETHHLLFYDMHHIISDGVSMQILISEFQQLYGDGQLAPLHLQYKDFAVWQQGVFSRKVLAQKTYWKQQFEGEIPVLDLPLDHARPAVKEYEGATYSFVIPDAITEKLKQLSQYTGKSVFAILLAAYNAFLHKYTHQDDIVIGAPVAGRPHADVEGIMGMFVNTLALRNHIDQNGSFYDLLHAVNTTLIGALDHQDYPFEELVRDLNLKRDMSRNPLFDTMFSYQDVEGGALQVGELTMEGQSFDSIISKFDLTLHATNTDTLQMSFEYATSLLEAGTMARFAVHFVELLSVVVRQPDVKIKDISLISEDEKQKVVNEFNNTNVDYGTTTILDKFQQIVQGRSSATAITFGDSTLTFGELDERSNQVAHYLLENDLQKGDTVALYLDRSEKAIISMLGIVKAGIAYVPIDTSLPENRVTYILEDSAAKWLITDQDIAVDMNSMDVRSEWSSVLTNSTSPPSVSISQEDTAYMIYTSGSTGQPKGCKLTHGNLHNYTRWATDYYFKEGEGNFGLYTSLSFDLTITSIYCALLKGRALYIYNSSTSIDEILQHSFTSDAVDSIKITPAHISLLKQLPIQNGDMKVAVVGGDKLTKDQVNVLKKIAPSIRIYNEYGPTETTVGCIVKEVVENEQITIGKPIANTEIFITNDGMLSPIGVAGEILITGKSVGLGYHNRPDLTADKFINNVFSDYAVAYRTGDLARWLPDGNIDFIGRVDHQAKIRGYRIELEEIENKLLEQEGVTEACVVVRENENNDKLICAYIIGNAEGDELRVHLTNDLPDYMIPTYFRKVDHIPLTSNGKVDTAALPEIEFRKTKKYVSPTTEVEKHLAEIWQNVLGAEKVGLNDNFFDLGGDSIKAIQVSARLKTKGFKIDIQGIFKQPLLGELAKIAVAETSVANQSEVTGTAPLTPIQSKFLQNYPGDKNHFNQSLMLYSENGLNAEWIERVFDKLIQHHDTLRSSFTENLQTIAPYQKGKFKLAVASNLSTTAVEEEAQKAQQSFDIDSGNLVKTVLFKTDKGDHLLMIIHHLIVDGISWRIILEDFNTLYGQSANGEELKLPLKTDSFLDWSKGLTQIANQKSFINRNRYWIDCQLSEVVPLFESTPLSGKKHQYNIRLSVAETDLLLKKSNKAFNTSINDLLITALGESVSRQFEKNEFLLGLEGHGREEILSKIDISRTVGWFTSEFPFLYKTSGADLATAIIHTKEALHAIPYHGVGFGMLDALTNDEHKHNFKGAKAQLLFNYLGQLDDSASSEWFEISPLSTGDNKQNNSIEYPIQTNGMVVKGELTFDFECDSEVLSQTQLQQLSEGFKAQLVNIILLCTTQQKQVLTPSDYGIADINFGQLEKIHKAYNYNIEKIYPLSPMQQGMLFVNIMEGQEDAYFEQSVLDISGALETDKVENVFNELIRRHEIIRSNVAYENLPRPYSIIAKEKCAKIYVEDLSLLNAKEQEEHLGEYMQNQKKKGFNLAVDLLMNLSVFKLADEQFKIVWSHHHIIMDGWCLGIILSDFFTLYNTEKEKLAPTTAYSEYISWLENQDKESALEYWQNVLGDYTDKAEVPGKTSMSLAADRHFVSEQIQISGTSLFDLETIAKQHHVTVFNIIQTIWGILLQKYNSTHSAVFGSVVSGRPTDIGGVEDMVGLFINTVPVNVSREKRFIDTVVAVQRQFNQSDQYSYLPLNEIQNLSDFKNELIDHIIVYESYPLDENAKKLNEQNAGLEITNVETHEITNYDFTITVYPGTSLTIAFDYNTSVYDGTVINQVVKSFNSILDQVAANPDIEVDRIELLYADEVQELLALNPQEVNPVHNSFIEMFNSVVGSFGETTALKYGNRELTYSDLNNRSNAIAHTLINQGIQRNDVVGIYTKPCFEMVEGILGILKTGAAYLPIDINYPEERIAYMLQDSKAKAILFTGDKIKGDDDIPLFDLKNDEWKSADTSTPAVNIDKQDGAYIIYTSGSTGTPKGVVISQESFVDYIEMIDEKFAISEHDTMLQHASIAFDTTIEELFPILSVGGKMVLPKDNKDFVEMLDHIASGEITYFCTSPLVLNYINEENKGLGNLRLVTVGGDELKKSYVNNIIDQVSIHNGYGPTESTVCATYYKVKGDEDAMPIGTPFRNRSAYVCNHDGNLLPKGIAGELCVGGKGLALKYLNQPEMTAEKFVPNPYDPDTKIYKTGDLVRWNEAGVLDFFGRIDNQIQIRGFRVELGEIEAKINALKEVSEVAVLAWEEEETNSKFLCAYIVSKLKEEDVLARLDGKLPEYMIPSRFIFLDKLPLTINGKVDRKKLEKPELFTIEIVEAENDRQEILVKVWKEVLKKDNIGIANNFFSLGGDSIKAIQVASKIQQYELKLDMRDLFAHPTIEELEPYLTELTFKADQGLVSGRFDLTPIQKQFFEENLEYPHHYNQSLMLYSKEPVSEKSWRKVLLQLVEHHDALRTRFDKEATAQHIHTELEKSFSLQVFAMNNENEISAKAQELQSQLNIYDGPLIASAIFETGNGAHVLLAIHHLVIDGISWRIMLEDIEKLISGEELPRKTQSFGSWSELLSEYANDTGLIAELPYWEETDALSNVWSYGNITYNSSEKTAFEFDEVLTTALLEEVNIAYNTEVNDILMAALALSLSEITGRQENKIYLEGHGRENLVEQQDISRTVGWFTSMFPVKLDNEYGELSDHIKNIKESLRKIPNKGVGYGILRYMNADVVASKKLHAIPEITFNYLGQYEEEDEGVFHISNISPGYAYNQANIKESAVDISGIVQHGKLIMDVTFDRSITSERAVEDFIASFTLHLKNIISHCLGKEGSEKTVSDFADADLSNDELDDIMGMLDGI